MYLFILASSMCMTYMAYKAFWELAFQPPVITHVTGVTSEGMSVETLTEDDEYAFYKHYYTFENDDYCMISESLETAIPLPRVQSSRYVVHAEVRTEETALDVTEKVVQVAGPRCDFHDTPIDFGWVFPYCEGSLHIRFNDTECDIDIRTNTVTQGDVDIPLIEYEA